MTNLRAYISAFQEAFESASNEEIAAGQMAYMKDKFAFLGIKSPVRKELTKQIVQQHGLPQLADLQNFAHEMWIRPEREYQYACLDILIKFKNKVGPEMLPFYHFLVVNKSWWDTVDLIASHLVGALVKKHKILEEKMDEWIQDENMWIRRVALLHQLKYKQDTDVEMLFQYCKGCAHEDEFFIRKAIGWALREYSKQDSAAVRRFVADNPQLSGLSKREALKWLERRENH